MPAIKSLAKYQTKELDEGETKETVVEGDGEGGNDGGGGGGGAGVWAEVPVWSCSSSILAVDFRFDQAHTVRLSMLRIQQGQFVLGIWCLMLWFGILLLQVNALNFVRVGRRRRCIT